MIDKITYLETDSEKFPLAFTLNIMEALQDEYGTLSEWSELIRNQKEPNIKALKFFITEAINEGIDIENEKSDEKRASISSAKAGRIITEIGFQKVAKTINKMVSESVKAKENSKNVKSTKNQEIQLIFRGYYLSEQKCSASQKMKSGISLLRSGIYYIRTLKLIIISAYPSNCLQKKKTPLTKLLMSGCQIKFSF